MLKKLLFLLSFLIISFVAESAYYVVSNVPEDSARFRSIQSAIEYASSFDTVFVKGSPLNYGNVLIEKPITLIGEGFTGENVGGHTSKVTRVLLTSNPFRRTISSGTKIIGFEFPYFPGERPNIVTVSHERHPIENITIERNWLWFIQVVGLAEGWQIRNNIIRGWVHGGARPGNQLSGAKSFSIANNIVNSLKGFSRGKDIIQNNVILGRLENIYSAEVFNNIFINDDYIIEKVFACNFRNNITQNKLIGSKDCYVPPDTFEAVNNCGGSPNRSINNRVGVEPGFLFWPASDIMGGAAFELSQSSQVKKTGIKGQDPGIFDGPHPFPVTAFLNHEIENPFPTFVTCIK